MVGNRSALSVAMVTGIASMAISLVACGARGPLDTPDYYFGQVDSGDLGGDDGAATDATTASDSSTSKDAGAEAASNPINCAVCVGQSCSNQIIACVTSQSCIGTLQCVFSKCLTGGSVNTTCAFGCAGEGGPQGLLDVLAVFQCVTGSCGPDCASVIGGLGAGLGGGGAPAGPLPGAPSTPAATPAAPAEAEANQALISATRDAFALFPQMCAALPTDVSASPTR